ncbi:glycosyltransferase family 2 protein [Epilithonimonas sp.]|uniref:glycosyltransferase family 2 protein n=1 Tax=Epilithonimonas sp. TaxID=2894511 RepID=UPI00289F0674|nr:glycosyltransferase family 2 protein [Epilithonimonas sp.]
MTFSILIAHYKNYDYFKECHDSILKQTYQNYEVVLVDDHSPDDSFEKIVELTKGDPRFRLFRNEENKGVGFTKKRCVDLAKGDICGFVDPDDAIRENAIEKSLEHFSSDKTSAVYSQLEICDNQLIPQKIYAIPRQVKNNDRLFFNIFLEVNHFFTFRKSAYDKTNGINPELTSAVDQDLYIKLYETGNLKFIKEPLYLYRIHDKGVSQEKSKKQKLNQNWHQVISDTLKRRNITKLYGKDASIIKNLPEFVFAKQNTFLKKLIKKFL